MDLQFRSSPDSSLTCPVCVRPTDSLKQYRYVRWCVFYLAGAAYRVELLRGCPSCLRAMVWRRCLANAIPANALWVIGLLPWAVGLTIASRRPGHSAGVMHHPMPALAAVHEVQASQLEVSWGRVCAIIAVLFFWAPLVGLIVGGLAWWLNRRAAGWTRPAGRYAFAAAVVLHVALVVLIVAEGARRG